MNAMRILVTMFASLSFVMPAKLTFADDAKKIADLHVTEIDDSVRLIGRLGIPLGTMVSVVGTWGYPDQSKGRTKDYSLRFTITSINGKSIPHPIIFPIHSVSVTNGDRSSLIPPTERHADLDGKRWLLRVYETGQYTVVPTEYWAYVGHPAMAPEPAFASSIVSFRDSE